MTRTISPLDKIKAKHFVGELFEAQIKLLATEGILSDDIIEILYFKAPEKNTFHSKEKREITKLEIQTAPLPKGRDYDWMYGFKKQLLEQGIGMCPAERNFYLAGKYYYEPDNLTEIEVGEIFQDGSAMSELVEWGS